MSLSPERNGRLTASNFAAAMGVNPYMSRQKLYRQLTGIDEPFTGNQATEWGQAHEVDAIDAYEAEFGVILDKSLDDQEFVIHPDNDWLGATVDGFNGAAVIEAKCPYSLRLYDDVPEHYMPQIQGQMEITGRDVCHFICWTPDEFAVWEVVHRKDYIEAMIALLDRFYKSWKAGEEPRRAKKPILPKVTTARII
jgi:uracil-DNA glycosylase